MICNRGEVALRAGRMGFLLASLLALACAENPRGAPEARPNVLLYVVDTLRADALEPYGNQRIHTPALVRLASEGVVYDRAYSASSWTRPSMASLLSGLEPDSHGVEDRGDRLGETVTLLSERFAAAGYSTGCIITNPNIGPYFGFDQGYDSFLELYDTSLDRARDSSGRVPPREFITASDVVTARAIEWIEEVAEPFFLLVLTIDPHTPYEPPQRFDRYGDDAARAVDRATLRINSSDLTRAQRDRIRALYHGEVSFNDDSFGKLLEHLRETERYDETIVVFTSDHGEEFWERGNRGHGRNLYEETIRVPLIVRDPASPRHGVREATPVRAVDIYPTLLHMASLPDAKGIDGHRIRGGSEVRARPVRTRLHFEENAWRSLTLYPWKLLVDVNAERHRLFDLGSDPGESRDLSFEHPAKVEALNALLSGTERSDQSADSSAYPDDLPESAREALRVLGYLGDDEAVDDSP